MSKPRDPQKAICIRCGTVFVCWSSKAMFCSEKCRDHGMEEMDYPERHRRHEEARRQMREVKEKPVSLETITAWQAEHKRLTGEWLGYHQAVEQMRKEGYVV